MTDVKEQLLNWWRTTFDMWNLRIHRICKIRSFLLTTALSVHIQKAPFKSQPFCTHNFSYFSMYRVSKKGSNGPLHLLTASSTSFPALLSDFTRYVHTVDETSRPDEVFARGLLTVFALIACFCRISPSRRKGKIGRWFCSVDSVQFWTGEVMLCQSRVDPKLYPCIPFYDPSRARCHLASELIWARFIN